VANAATSTAEKGAALEARSAKEAPNRLETRR